MLKGEIEILIAVALNKRTFKQIVSSQTTLNSPYIISTIEALIRDGYITRSRSGGYQITEKGIGAAQEYLPKNRIIYNMARGRLARKHSSQAKDAIEMIEKLATEYHVKMDQ